MSKVDYTGTIGDQRPRLSHLPIKVDSAGPAGLALCEMAGLHLDDWQAWLLDQILGEREETYFNEVLQRRMRKSSAYEAALVVARQNGKGSWLEGTELSWLFLLGAKTILHSAHEMGTSKEHFERITGLIMGCPELKAELAVGGIRIANGDERVKLASDQRLIFKTRTRSAARGFSIDKLVMDEAMILKDDAVKAMLFATSARPDPQILYTGSVGNRESLHFGRARSRGVNKSDPRLLFAEWSAELCSLFCERGPLGQFICPIHDDRADPRTWFKANPGLGVRLQLENVNSEYGSLSEEAFNEERLSVGDWPSDGAAWAVITEEGWLNCLDRSSQPGRDLTFAIDTSPDKRWSAIVAAGANADGNIHIEVTGNSGYFDYRAGSDWVVQRAIEINSRQRGAQWVINKSTQAGIHWDELEKAGLRVVDVPSTEYAQSCGGFFAGIMPIGGSKPDIRHLGQPELYAAVAAAEKRDLPELWVWDKRNASQDISCLVASTLAVWGHRKRMHKRKPKPMAAWV